MRSARGEPGGSTRSESSGRRGGGGRCVRGRGEGGGTLQPTVFAPPAAISFRVQSSRGDGRPHVAHSGRRLRREVLRGAARDAPRRAVPADAEDLLVGLDPADDAAVYRLDDERAIVFTVDFFPPLVDDPRTFGAIAATNALNDVFAMGGLPLLALSVAAFPEELPVEVLGEVLSGRTSVFAKRARFSPGAHDPRTEPKYGSLSSARCIRSGSGRRREHNQATSCPHEAFGKRDRPASGTRRNRASRNARRCDRVDARAQQRGRRRPPTVRAERRDGRHRIRAAWPCARARSEERRARHSRRELVACASGALELVARWCVWW